MGLFGSSCKKVEEAEKAAEACKSYEEARDLFFANKNEEKRIRRIYIRRCIDFRDEAADDRAEYHYGCR